jgi:hypothetical protein
VSAALERALLERREALRGELQAQRAQIAQALGSAPAVDRAFPRSHTMRLLATRPLQIIRVLVGVIGLLRGR